MVLWLKTSFIDRGMIKIPETDLANESKTLKIDFE
jgi:hypothetical protein